MPTEQLSSGVLANSLIVLPANGTAGTAFAIPEGDKRVSIGWEIIPTGGPSALSNALQVSNDNTNWTTIDSDTTAAGCNKTVPDVVAKYIRIYHTSHTGGTGLTARILLRDTAPNSNVESRGFADGSASYPAIFFTRDRDSGVYSDSTGMLRFVVGGQEIFRLESTQVSSYKFTIAAGHVFGEYTAATDWFASSSGDGAVTNYGASGTVTVTLNNPGLAGTKVNGIVVAAQTLELKVPTGKFIRNGASISADGGKISSNTIGNVVNLMFDGRNTWFVTAIVGTWTLT